MKYGLFSLLAALLFGGAYALAQDTVIVPLTEDRPAIDTAEEEAEADAPLPPPVPDEFGVQRIATIRALDKITARVRDIEAPIGVPVHFESFEIIVRTCHKRPPEETPETTAFVQITDHRHDGEDAQIFSGWMFASSPALNPVEHPTYDVWLIDCRTL